VSESASEREGCLAQGSPGRRQEQDRNRYRASLTLRMDEGGKAISRRQGMCPVLLSGEEKKGEGKRNEETRPDIKGQGTTTRSVCLGRQVRMSPTVQAGQALSILILPLGWAGFLGRQPVRGKSYGSTEAQT
jgi:hypothetical protein